MFILKTDRPPATTAELIDILNRSLRDALDLSGDVAPVTGSGELPDLQNVAIDISDGEIDPDRARENLSGTDSTQPGVQIENLTVVANPVWLNEIPIELNLSANQSKFSYGENRVGQFIATLTDAAKGQLSVQLRQHDLETTLLQLTRKYSASTGVSIEKVGVALTRLGPRELDVLLEITAKKFVTAIVRIVGRLSVDDDLVASATNLKASSTGMVGSIAVNLLQPQLQKLEGRKISLLNFSLGDIKLRDIQADVTDGLRLTAAFGSEGV